MVDTFKPISISTSALKTSRRHRRETWWQVTFPLLIGLVGVLILSVVTSSVSSVDVSRLAKMAVIWLLIPALVLSVIFFVILVGLIYVLVRLIAIIPHYSYRVQYQFARVGSKSEQICNLVSEPIIRIRSFRAGLRVLRKRER
jgi:hypothetical protein